MIFQDPLSGLIPILHVAAALAAGGAIGAERTFRGRAAGFRTYALVCMGSAMAMVVATFPNPWLGGMVNAPGDVTRIVQGILTGIGFLGAGIIVKHGFDVRGLTTAASIWATAVIGVLIGGRHYWVATASVALVLGTLSLFRRIEDRMGKEQYARVTLSVSRTPGLPKAQVDALIRESGLQIEQVSYGLERDRITLDYTYVVSGFDAACFGALAERLAVHPEIIAFRIAPSHE